MFKTVRFAILVMFLTLFFGTENIRSQTPEANLTPAPRGRSEPIVLNKAADVHTLELDKDEAVLRCPRRTKAREESCSGDALIEVLTGASDPENDTLVYIYTVTGGKIEGQGASVKWDLSAVRPGSYQIITGVDDGCGVCGKTMTKTVTVKECVSCGDECECYSFAVKRGAETVKQGKTITFTVSLSGGNVTVEKYNWHVTGGRIIKGQGTETIKVKANELAGKMITAGVELGGPHECLRICPIAAWESVMVTFNN
jgi:hypothetical protein